MKNHKGITLVSLVIYIVVMLLVISVMSMVSIVFYNNAKGLDDSTQDLAEFNNFNNYFVKEIKTANNKIDEISNDGTYIIFNTGNTFSFKNNAILYNNIEIAKNVNDVTFSYYIDNSAKRVEDVVTVKIDFNNYSKQMNYKIEDIY